MRVLFRLVALATIVALWSSTAMAQRQFGFGGSGTFLLGQESVRKELKLSEEQIKKVEDLSAAMREKFKEAFSLEGDERRTKLQELRKENEKAVAEILKPQQSKRLKQISYQQQGAGAFNEAEVVEALKLTDDQKQEVEKINKETFAQMRELFKEAAEEEGRKKIEELRKDASEKVVKLLTDEQKAKWKDLQGEPFKGEIRFTPRKKKE